MGTTNDQSALVGDFIDAWGDSITELFKFVAPLLNKVPFKTENQVGGKYHQVVDLQQEHGFTMAAAGSDPTLLDPIAGQTGDAQVEGVQLYGRARVSYESIARSQQQGKMAVKEATKLVVRRLGLSATKRLELQFLHGRRGLGIISALASETGSGPYSTVITITDEQWSGGIWAGMEGAQLDVYASPGGALSKQAAPDTTSGLTITAVDPTNKTITVSYTTARGSWNVALATTQYIFLRSGTTTTEFAGLDVWARNTGNLYNINAANYSLWGGNVYSTSTGPISMAKILEATGLTASYGNQGMETCVVISPKGFEVLNGDQAALRQYDMSYRPANAESGAEGLKYHAQTGIIEILPHAFQKDGLVHGFVPEETRRIGATDLTFIDRGGSQPRLILESANSPSSEMRIQSHQALFVDVPRHTFVMGGITY